MSSNPPEPAIEQLGLHLTREWLFDHQIVVYTIASISRETVDQWADSVKDLRNMWPADRPYLTMYDTSPLETSMTPYLRWRFEELMRIYVDVPGRTAVVVRKSFMMNLLQLFFNSHAKGLRQRRIFFHREDGLGWLQQELTERT